MISEQQAEYSFGKHSLSDKFKPNLPFILYWTTASKPLIYNDIWEIDSIDRDKFLKFKMSEHKTVNDPVVLYFGEKTELKISKPVDTHTEYTLFTYLNNVRYYLARGSGRYNTNDGSEQYRLVLTSAKNKNMMKGDR